jgi:UDP-3-O-[3-hydroxymyristoyl] glucosamine N-acyltransferase
VEVGANTTIDCGAIDDTVIEDGVRLDNLVHIAHSVHIGEHTAIAALSAFAGSTRIGKRCMFGGNAGAVGQITVCDDVIVMSQSVLSKDTHEPGIYSSSFPAEPAKTWAKQVARFRRLEGLFDKVKKLGK